jgi:hypothetical protein
MLFKDFLKFLQICLFKIEIRNKEILLGMQFETVKVSRNCR